MFLKDKADYSLTGDKNSVSSMRLAGDVSSGNGLLLLADGQLQSTVTKSLRDLINASGTMNDEDGQYLKFITALGNIPDWDGSKNVWAVNLAAGQISPYIQTISDASLMIAQSTTLPFSGGDATLQYSVVAQRVNKSFSPLFEHNALVYRVLMSYTPYSSQPATDLRQILQVVGALENFAMFMNVSAFITQLVIMQSAALSPMIKDPSGVSYPSLVECFNSYPELFDDDMTKVLGLQKSSIPPMTGATDYAYQTAKTLKIQSQSRAQISILGKQISGSKPSDLNNGYSTKDVLDGKVT